MILLAMITVSPAPTASRDSPGMFNIYNKVSCCFLRSKRFFAATDLLGLYVLIAQCRSNDIRELAAVSNNTRPALSQPANGRRFSSLIATEERFAKRPLAVMSEEKRLSFAGQRCQNVSGFGVFLRCQFIQYQPLCLSNKGGNNEKKRQK